jgi:glutathione S-transferase
MIVLHKFVPGYGLPDMSPFVIKLETYLRMAGLEYRSVISDSRKAPKGKFPYIEDDGRVIADSTLVIEYLEAKAAAPLDAGLDARQRAAATAFKGLLEEHTYFLVLWRRWIDEAGWVLYRPALKAYASRIGVPSFAFPLIAGSVRRDVRRRTLGQGTGRHTPAEIGAMGAAHVQAVADWLGDQPYFLGDRPRVIDATVFAFMASELWAPFGGPAQERLRASKNLVAYCERMRAQWWGDWPQ